jgi:hypothetical protein
MKVYRKVDDELRTYEYTGRDMNAARSEVAGCTSGRGAILIDVGTIPPAPPILLRHYGPHFGVRVSPKFKEQP